VLTAAQYITACIADVSCTVEGIEVNVPITSQSAKARKSLLSLKAGLAVAFLATTIIGSYLPFIFRSSRHFTVRSTSSLLIVVSLHVEAACPVGSAALEA
jgi:hypothetical protein